MRRIGFTVLAVSLALASVACAPTENTSPATDALNRQYAGHKIDGFFLSYGKPTGKPTPTADGSIYHWVSIEPTMDQPVSAGFRGTPAIVQSESGNTGELYCEINIHTDKSGIIRNFTGLNDSQGKYTTSYCNDIFISPATHKSL